MKRLVALSVVGALLLSACGYSLVVPGRWLPVGTRTVYVDRVRLTEGSPPFGDALRRQLRVGLRRQGRLRPVESDGTADAVLRVRISRYSTRPVAFNEFDEVLDYSSTLVAEVSLSTAEGVEVLATELAVSRGHAAVAESVVVSSSAFQSEERLLPRDLKDLDGVQLGEDRRLNAQERLVSDLTRAIIAVIMEGA